ncbi:MAG: YheC/YheD family protein [Paenibacillaceae bacterium]|nr:YheC/YheD family protein [Paenibacillaceae bacterium]
MIVAVPQCDVYVFSPTDVHPHRDRPVYAHTYDGHTKRWARAWREMPDVIYDRARVHEHTFGKQRALWRSDRIVWANRPLGNKWTVHRRLIRDAAIRAHIPHTVRWSTHLTEQHPCTYIKPIRGTGGRGIVRITKTKTGYVIHGRNMRRAVLPMKTAKHWNGALAIAARIVRNTPCIAQQGIDTTLPDGRVHDVRVLIQKDRHGAWRVTGIAARIGRMHSVTANLHGGGTASPLRDILLRNGHEHMAAIREKLLMLAHRIAVRLERSSEALCELGLDFAIDRSGTPWLLEVNPKPSRDIFRRLGWKKTYANAISRPILYAMWLAQHRASRARTQIQHAAQQEVLPPYTPAAHARCSDRHRSTPARPQLHRARSDHPSTSSSAHPNETLRPNTTWFP